MHKILHAAMCSCSGQQQAQHSRHRTAEARRPSKALKTVSLLLHNVCASRSTQQGTVLAFGEDCSCSGRAFSSSLMKMQGCMLVALASSKMSAPAWYLRCSKTP